MAETRKEWIIGRVEEYDRVELYECTSPSGEVARVHRERPVWATGVARGRFWLSGRANWWCSQHGQQIGPAPCIHLARVLEYLDAQEGEV